MKMPAEKRTHCRSCNKHTVHDVLKAKKHKASELKAGQRQFRRVMSGYGGFPRPQLKGAGKPTKKVSIILRCKECTKAHNVKGFRVRTFEIVEA